MMIILYKSEYRSLWDQFVKSNIHGTVYHLSCWKDVIEKTFGFEPVYLMALNEGDEVKGVLPLFLMKDVFGRRYLISVPFSNYAGVCAVDNKIRIELLEKAKEIAVQKQVQYIEIRQYAEQINGLPAKNDFVTMLLKLESDEESVWTNSLTSATRNKVRKASKRGLTIDFGRQYLDEFYSVLSTNMRDLGTPIYPKVFFANILEKFGESADFIVVKHQSRVIAAMLTLRYKNVISEPWVSSLKKYNRLFPNNMLYWEAIKYAYRNGFEYFDFGRSTLDSGTFNFKRHWGAKPVQLHYQYYFNKAKKIPVVNAYDNKYDLAIKIWKKMPIMCANTLGPKIVKYLPEL